MPGFVNPDEQESRQELYRDLLTKLNTEFINPYRFGETSFDQNPVKFIDKSLPDYQESIYAEPSQLPTIDTGGVAGITKTDAVKMLAKGAKEFFGKSLRKLPKDTVDESWLYVGGTENETLRANVRDIIRSARRTPQHLLTPLESTEIIPIKEENILGKYYKQPQAAINVDPSKANTSANTWFHEVIHGRHIDAPFYAKPTDQMTAGDVYKRYLELITKQTADVGESVASKTGKRFYWDNPKELVARNFADIVEDKAPEFISDPKNMEGAYTRALEYTVARMQSKAPKTTKRMADRIKMDMRKQFPGLDWEDIVRKVGKDRPRVGASYEGIEDTLLSEINPKWSEPFTKQKTFKKIDTYAAEAEPMKSLSIRDKYDRFRALNDMISTSGGSTPIPVLYEYRNLFTPEEYGRLARYFENEGAQDVFSGKVSIEKVIKSARISDIINRNKQDIGFKVEPKPLASEVIDKERKYWELNLKSRNISHHEDLLDPKAFEALYHRFPRKKLRLVE